MRTIALIAVVLLASPVSLFAEQYANNNGQVVHTRVAPVSGLGQAPNWINHYHGRLKFID